MGGGEKVSESVRESAHETDGARGRRWPIHPVLHYAYLNLKLATAHTGTHELADGV